METINTSAPWGGEGVSSIQTSIPRAPALETLSCSYCRCFSLRNRIKDDTEGENQKRSYTAAPGKHGRVSMCLNTILSYHPLHLIWSVNEMLFQLGAPSCWVSSQEAWATFALGPLCIKGWYIQFVGCTG